MISRIKKLFTLLNLANKFSNLEIEKNYRKIATINIFTLMVILTPLIGTVRLFTGFRTLAIIDYFTTIIMLFVLYLIKKAKETKVFSFLSVFIVYLLFLYLFNSGGAADSGILWMYTFPFVSFWVLGIFSGSIASAILFVSLVVSKEFSLPMYTATYPPAIYYNFLFSYIIVILIAFSSEIIRLNTYKKLISSEKKLKHSNDELELFAHKASHDLQEPLRMVTSYVQLLAKRNREKFDSDSKKFIDFAVDGTERMRQLITDLLQYSKITSGENLVCDIDTNDILKNILLNLELTIKENNAQIIYEDLPVIRSVKVQLTQIFQNLIENAIKFCINKNPTIHIGFKLEDGAWVFSIKDNGPGIPDEYKDRIFHIFMRLDSSNKPKGTGIGLSICKKIIETNGGKIWVESEVGNGSTFYFTIPKV